MHESARADALASARQASFIVSRLAGAGMSGVTLLGYLALAPHIEPVVVGALTCMMLPAVAAIMLMRTGALAAAHLISAALFGTLVLTVAAATGGLTSFLAPWFLVVPVEAALSGSRRVVMVVLAGCIAAVGALAMLSQTSMLPASLLPDGGGPLYGLIGLAGALVYAGMLAATIEYHFDKSDSAVQSTEERYRLLAENATDMITRHRPTGDVVFVAGASTSLVDCDRSVLMGGGLMGLVHMDDRRAYAEAFAKAVETGGSAAVEFRLASNIVEAGDDVSYRWVELRCRAMSGDGAAEPGTREVVAVTRDVSGRKRRQEELRTARDAAEQASRAKTQFLANMSHELRTPLNSVIGFAEVLERDLADNRQHDAMIEYASLIRQSGKHLLGVVNDLLDLSRIESGNVTLNREPVDLNEVARYCKHTLQVASEEGGINVVLQQQSDELVIDADRKACIQIILNLLSNAVKFSRSGGRVLVSTRSDGETATIAVRDEGVGIARSLVGRLGQPFTQGDSAYSRSHEGAGLGLSIVKGLVKFHGGTMQIDSTEGVGTCVTVTLPTRGVDAAVADHFTKGAAPNEPATPIV